SGIVDKNGSLKSKSSGFKLSASKLLFPDKAITWLPGALLWSIFHKEKFLNGTVLTTSPLYSNHLIGLILKKIYNVKWIVDVRDFHYLNNLDKGDHSIISRLQKWLENTVIKNADIVTFSSESMKENYSAGYPLYKNKFNVIYNGFDPEEFNFTSQNSFETLPVKIFYSGSFYKGIRSPLPLIFSLQQLINNNDIKPDDIKIEIAGNFEKELLQEISDYSVSTRIKFLGKLPRSRVLELMQKAHLLWLIV